MNGGKGFRYLIQLFRIKALLSLFLIHKVVYISYGEKHNFSQVMYFLLWCMSFLFVYNLWTWIRVSYFDMDIGCQTRHTHISRHENRLYICIFKVYVYLIKTNIHIWLYSHLKEVIIVK